MKFGPQPLENALGTVLAHSVDIAGKRLRKGCVLGEEEIAALRGVGHDPVIVARLDASDVDENTAAAQLARAIVPDEEAAGLTLSRAFTGRVNLIAALPGVVRLDRARLIGANRLDPGITVATVPDLQQMAPGNMVATVKIIPYGVDGAALERACALAKKSISMEPVVRKSASLIITDIPGGPGRKGEDAIGQRLEALGVDLLATTVVAHDTAALARAIGQAAGEMVLILTGSATSDMDDVGPAAVRAAGGSVSRFGIAVDPGNLLFLGEAGGRPVIGLPGCVRSPALNGADWVLSRVACGLAVEDADFAEMAVGGLLKEIPTRPQPRAGRKAQR